MSQLFSWGGQSIGVSALAFFHYSIRKKLERTSVQFSSVQFSHSDLSDSLRSHELQHTRPPCSSPTPGVHSHSHPSSRWCHPAISSSVVPFSSCPQSLPASVFSSESPLHLRCPKYWSFSFSIIPSKKSPGLILFSKYFRYMNTPGKRKHDGF